MSNRSLYGEIAVVGVGSSDYASLYQDRTAVRSREDLAIDAVARAIADAGVSKDQIDGLIASGVNRYEPFMFRSGMTDVRFLGHYGQSGRMCAVAIGQAAMAVLHGLADYVVLFHVLNFRSERLGFGGDNGLQTRTPGLGAHGDLYDLVYGMTSPGAYYALAMSRYMSLYGGTEEQLGEIAVQLRRHAGLTPQAIMTAPFTIDEYLDTRYIARPLRLYDYCLVNDGAAALVITTRERARDLPHPPVLIGSVAERANVREWYVDQDFWTDACQSLKRDLLDSVGLTLGDIGSVQVYDNFSPSVLWVLEGFGFAPKGQGLEWVQGGRIGLGGELPVNTSGGMLSESYLQGWNNHVEAVRQLRGEAEGRQVPGCKAILYTCLSAIPGGTVLIGEDLA